MYFKLQEFFNHLLLALFLVLAISSVKAEEVKLVYKGITLNANLEFAKNKNLSHGVILMTHAGLAHNVMETMAYLQSLLKGQGYNTLAITLSLGIDNRHGMYDCQTTHRHRYADASDEISAWVAWLEKKGAGQIILFGHSRGGAQTVLYASEQTSKKNNDLVKAIVLLAPDTQATNNAIAYERRHQVSLAPVLNKARKLVSEAMGDTILEHTGVLYCKDTSVAAGTIVSYYGKDPRLDTAYLIPSIKKPLLIMSAGGDQIVVGHVSSFLPLVDGGRVQMKIIEGADHFFRDLFADDAVDEMVRFLCATNTD